MNAMPHTAESLPGYRAAVERSALFELAGRTLVELSGKDRAAFLHNFCTGDVKKLAAGACVEAFLTTGQAKLLAWLQILAGEETLLLGAEPDLGGKIAAWLDRFIITEDVRLADRSAEFSQLLLTGPGAAAVVSGLIPAAAALDSEWRHQEAELASVPVRLLRRAWLNLPGWFIFAPTGQADRVRAAILAAGAEPGGADAYEALRLEAGVPAYGIDLDETNLPQEANRTAQAISFTKGCYLGQETVARIHAYGHVNRLRVTLRLAADALAAPAACRSPRLKLDGARLTHAAKEVGAVTSLVWSPLLGGPLAMGFVRRGHEQPGAKLDFEAGAARGTAEVIGWPRPPAC